MKITITYPDQDDADLHTLIKDLAKSKGRHLKDIAKVELAHRDTFLAISLWDTDGKFVTNCAC